MNDHVYKLLDLVGTSNNSIEEAIQNAVSRATEWQDQPAPHLHGGF